MSVEIRGFSIANHSQNTGLTHVWLSARTKWGGRCSRSDLIQHWLFRHRQTPCVVTIIQNHGGLKPPWFHLLLFQHFRHRSKAQNSARSGQRFGLDTASAAGCWSNKWRGPGSYFLRYFFCYGFCLLFGDALRSDEAHDEFLVRKTSVGSFYGFLNRAWKVAEVDLSCHFLASLLSPV